MHRLQFHRLKSNQRPIRLPPEPPLLPVKSTFIDGKMNLTIRREVVLRREQITRNFVGIQNEEVEEGNGRESGNKDVAGLCDRDLLPPPTQPTTTWPGEIAIAESRLSRDARNRSLPPGEVNDTGRREKCSSCTTVNVCTARFRSAAVFPASIDIDTKNPTTSI